MVIRDLLQVMRRRWGIVATVLAVVTMVALYLLSTAGVYTTRTSIAFTIPSEAPLDDDGSAEPGIITFAATVARAVDPNASRPHYAAADARAYGIGVRQAVLVGVPDVGGQWTTSYRTAVVTIEVNGPSYSWVQAEQEAAISRVIDEADAQQEAIGIAEGARVQYAVDPLSKDIEHVLPGASALVLAFGALAAASVLVAAYAAVWWDDRRARQWSSWWKPRRADARGELR